MVVRKTLFAVDEYYHIYNRGIMKTPIFLDEADKKRFIKLLFVCNSDKPVVFKTIQGLPLDEIERGEALVDIGAYCLMPNHFHILIHERVDGGISMFMEKLSTAYVMYFNTKNNRTGRLFEGTFKAKHVENEPYFNWVFSYIHLNPVKLIDSKWKEYGISDPISAKNFMQNYKYSSYYDYFVGDRPEGAIVNRDAFPEHFSQLDDFGDLVQEFRTNDY